MPQILDHRAHLSSRSVADRVGDVYRRRAGADRRVDYARQKLGLAAHRVLGREFDVRTVFARVRGHIGGAGEHLVGLHFELVLHVYRRRRDKYMDSRRDRGLYRLPRRVNVRFNRARKSADLRILDLRRDLGDRIEVALRRYRESGFDYVDSQPFKLERDLELFFGVHRASGRLLAVAQCGVEYFDMSWHFSVA